MNEDKTCELYVQGALVETLRYEGPPAPGVYEGPEWESYYAAHQAFLARVEARAYELHGLAYERRNENWKESVHTSFRCEETPDGEHVRVFSPVGSFLLAARRARAGDYKTSLVVSATMTGYGAHAVEDQTSLPVRLHGRLNEPVDRYSDWTFQPGHFQYEDGTRSDFLGLYPRKITLEDQDPSSGA